MKKNSFFAASVLVCAAAVCFLCGNQEARCEDQKDCPAGCDRVRECPEKNCFHKGPAGEFARYSFMKEKLDLSDDQLNKIFEIEQKYRAERFSQRDSENADFKGLREKEQKEIRDVMTADQQKKLDEFHKNMESKKPAKGKKPMKGKAPRGQMKERNTSAEK